MTQQKKKQPFAGSLKPMCQLCCRRVYGVLKNGGWWCSNCERWVVKPQKQADSRPAGEP